MAAGSQHLLHLLLSQRKANSFSLVVACTFRCCHRGMNGLAAVTSALVSPLLRTHLHNLLPLGGKYKHLAVTKGALMGP